MYSPVPQIKYISRAECTVEDDGSLISLYVEINPDPNRFVEATHPLAPVVHQVDIDSKGNVRGIEVVLQRV